MEWAGKMSPFGANSGTSSAKAAVYFKNLEILRKIINSVSPPAGPPVPQTFFLFRLEMLYFKPDRNTKPGSISASGIYRLCAAPDSFAFFPVHQPSTQAVKVEISAGGPEDRMNFSEIKFFFLEILRIGI